MAVVMMVVVVLNCTALSTVLPDVHTQYVHTQYRLGRGSQGGGPQSLGRVVKIEHRTYCMCGPSIENTSRTYILTVLASDPRRDQYPRNIQRDGYEDSFSVRKGTFPASDRPVA